jgi:hypothetical protein
LDEEASKGGRPTVVRSVWEMFKRVKIYPPAGAGGEGALGTLTSSHGGKKAKSSSARELPPAKAAKQRVRVKLRRREEQLLKEETVGREE